MSLIRELKRRNVLRVGAAYVVASWLLLQVIDVVGPILRLPEAVARYVLFLLVIGLLPALVLTWTFEWTPAGVRRDRDTVPAADSGRGRLLDRAIMVALALAVALLLFDRVTSLDDGAAGPDGTAAPAGAQTGAPAAPARATTAPVAARSVVVLPFVPLSNGPDDDYFADGLSEEIINALGQIPDLLVTGRTSAFHFKGKNLAVAEVARQLGVAHLVEGSVRRAGDQLRISAQLIRAHDGFQLWSETYDRLTEDTFAVQSDIAEKVAQALNVLLDDALRERMQRVGTRDVDAFIAFQKGIERYERAHQEANQISLLRQANIEFEQAIERAPELYPAYEYHSDLYIHIVLDHASGLLDGEITDADLAAAPDALRQDFDQAVRHARTDDERHNAQFGRILLFGPWRGLSLYSERAAAATRCEAHPWLALTTSAFGQAEAALEAFARMAACDPLRGRPMRQIARLTLWLGRPDEAVRQAQRALEFADDYFMRQALMLGLAFGGDAGSAERAAARFIRDEDELLSARATLAAIRGDGNASIEHHQAYLGVHGPDDAQSLILEALRGNRNEANRLAGAIDRRPFGHIVLLDSIFRCFCGAPFGLEATPAFAAMLMDSGLPWPPASPYDLPLKDG
jgi:TolB-like protein